MDDSLEFLAGIFNRARRIDPADRAAFLDEACSAQPALRREVEAMLAAHERSEDFDEPALPDSWVRLAEQALIGEPVAASETPSVAGYRGLGRLAAGSMGTVYLAEQIHPPRRVALKVLRTDAATDSRRLRFEQEAAVLARLDHPGIARIFEVGRTAGEDPRPYLAMEYVEGETLLERCASAPLTERVALLAETCDAIAHAHQKGVIHRDLKPEHVIVTCEGVVKVLDFGVARLTDEAAGAMGTRAGDVIGTLAYMSPEQARGDSASVDTRSDVYALGVIAYEVLCGRHPLGTLDGGFTQIVHRILTTEPPSPGSINRVLQGDLQLILGRALAKDPAQRYDGAGALAEDLRRYLRDEPILARPLTATYQLRRFLRRNKVLVAGAAATVGALVIGLVVALNFAASEREQRRRADRNAEARRLALAQRELDLAATALRHDDGEAARRALAAVPDPLRGWEWNYLSARTDTSIDSTPLGLRPTVGVALTSEPAWAFIAADGMVVWGGPGGSTERKRPAGWKPARAAALGTRLVFAGLDDNKRLAVWSPETRLPFEDHLPGPTGLTAATATHDGRRLALAFRTNNDWSRLRVYESGTTHPVWKGRGCLVSTNALAFDRTGRMLAAAGWDRSVLVYDIEGDGSPVRALEGHSDQPYALAFSHDGRWLASAGNDRAVRLWNVDSGAEVARLSGHTGVVRALAFGPGDTQLASAAADGSIRLWDVEAKALDRVLLGHTLPVRALSYGPSSVLTSLGEDALRRWDMGAGERDVLRGHGAPPYVYAAVLSPSEDRIASAGWDGTVRIVNSATGDLLATLGTGGGGPALDLAWSHDDAALFVVQDGIGRWDATKAVRIARRPHDTLLVCCALSPDGKTLVAGDERGRIVLYDPADLAVRETRRPHKARVHDVAISTDGRWVATAAGGGHVAVQALADGAERHRFRGFGGTPRAVAFSHDGRYLACGGHDHRVSVFDLETGAVVASLEGHTDNVYALAWLHDDSRLFSGANDATIRVWDVGARRECLVLRGHVGYVYGLDLSRDGSLLVSASGDNTVRLWSTLPECQRERVRTKARRRLTVGR